MRDDALVRFTAHEIPREDLHALMARSDGPALRRGVWHLGMLVLIGAALWRLRSTAWALPLVVVQWYMLAFIFCALHETAHRTAFQIGDILRLASGRADRPWMAPSERRPLIIEARAYLTVYLAVAAVSIAVGSPAALVVWIVPWMVGQAFLRPYLLAEHTACAFTRDCLENTRTTLTWPLVRLFAWNMPYHAEHHAYPAIPFHALPRLHARVRGEIENLEPGYVRASVKVARYLFGPLNGGRAR